MLFFLNCQSIQNLMRLKGISARLKLSQCSGFSVVSQCCVDRCLEMDCGSVTMVTSLLLRALLPSSFADSPTL